MKNNNISIISPASSFLKEYPNKVKRGCKFLESQGFNIKIENNAAKKESYYSANIRERIEDINNALNNENINIIMASIGGYNSNQLLEKLDYHKISKSNKLFCGYSDITCFILAIYSKTHKIVLHGPTFLPEICEYPRPYDYTWECFKQVLQFKLIEYKEPTYVVREFIDWKTQETKPLERRKEKNNESWTINKKGKATGKIIGGNLSSILTIIGTEFLPIEIFKDKILFLEDTNIDIAEFDSFMQSLKLRGVFNDIKGLIIGKFEDSKNNEQINNFLNIFLEDYDFPIIYNIDLGHTNPMITIPIGATVLLECKDKITFKIISYSMEENNDTIR